MARLVGLSPEAALEAAFGGGLLGMAVLGESDEILLANAAFARALGYQPAELAGMRLAALLGTPTGGESTTAPSGAAVARLKTKQGELLPAQLTVSRVLDREAGVTGLAFIEDIRPRQELEAERQRVEGQLRQTQKMDALAQLTGGIAHDFNNMLTVILANAELIAGVIGDDKDAQADLEELRTAARRGTAMVRKLLGFSRRERLVLQAVKLDQLVREVANQLRNLFPEPVRFDVRSDGTPDIQADTNAIEQILLNLLTNARDALFDGGEVIVQTSRVLLNAEDTRRDGWGAPGEYACLSVTDTGIGMDEGTRARLFEPFFTTKPPGLGTGLGMAMIYGLVKQHGGFVVVESQPKSGTTVRVHFPAAKSVATPVRVVEEPAAEGGAETILLVEDEESIRRTARRVLERFGYHVLTALDGLEGLEVIRAHGADIDLVITDVAMPNMGGRGLYDAARTSGATMKFLFASGYTQRDLGAIGDIDPALPFIHKPWTLSNFLRRVREVLDSKSKG